MVLGSGPDRLGKTGELDRFAFQALRFLKEQGHEVIWVDENPATTASSGNLAATEAQYQQTIASMRPEQFSSGNLRH